MLKRLALTLLLIAPSLVGADVFDKKNASLKAIGPFYVRINDSSQHECWTNSQETLVYAQDQLELAGAVVNRERNIVPHLNDGTVLGIYILADRFDGLCTGHINIQTEAFTRGKETAFGVIFYSRISVLVRDYDNLNNHILKYTKQAVAEWKAK